MNGIFGLLNLDGAPAAVDQLATMQEALDYWAVDGAQQWRSGEIGLGCLHLVSTPEAVGEQLPLHDAASGLTLTAGARLDNRDELLNHLKIEADHGRVAVTDGEIILRAYQKWGQECVHHLDGDWHFAIWDEGARCLFLARDHYGNNQPNPPFALFLLRRYWGLTGLPTSTTSVAAALRLSVWRCR